MTEEQTFNWVPGWKYRVFDGRKAVCLAKMDNGRACMHDTDTDGVWVVDAGGKEVFAGKFCNITAAPDVPEEEDRLIKGMQAERDAYDDGYRAAVMDSVEVLLENSSGMDRHAVAPVVRRLMQNFLTPPMEPPF